MKIHLNPGLSGGVNEITGNAINGKSEKLSFHAIPYFAIGNIKPGDKYKVWTMSR
jgi:hypothetical protein